MNVHFIAIGGSAMHNLAIALKKRGYTVSGSDDEIFEPARSRLESYGLLPSSVGWQPDKVHEQLDAVILGMHAKNDNPELTRARELNLKIYSYPEYLFEQSREKIRVVIAGSHGKTTITSMVLHVLRIAGLEADYMVGAQLEGFEVMVKLSEGAKYFIIEGDEYLSSALDPRPKFHLYRPHIALLSGIAWDHMNVFPTFGNYVSQFEQFADLIEPNGSLVYCEDDPEVNRVANGARDDIGKIPYGSLEYSVDEEGTRIICQGERYPVRVFGRHNIQNIHGAWMVCRLMGVSDRQFLEAIGSFSGASRRLQMIKSVAGTAIFKDFAHSPSKLKATIQAVKEQFPDRNLIACVELHTYSSLNKAFLPQYRGCMKKADLPVVYFSPHALSLKRLPVLLPAEVSDAFADDRLAIFTDPKELESFLLRHDYRNANLLMMSSGNFDGLNIDDLAEKIMG